MACLWCCFTSNRPIFCGPSVKSFSVVIQYCGSIQIFTHLTGPYLMKMILEPLLLRQWNPDNLRMYVCLNWICRAIYNLYSQVVCTSLVLVVWVCFLLLWVFVLPCNIFIFCFSSYTEWTLTADQIFLLNPNVQPQSPEWPLKLFLDIWSKRSDSQDLCLNRSYGPKPDQACLRCFQFMQASTGNKWCHPDQMISGCALHTVCYLTCAI